MTAPADRCGLAGVPLARQRRHLLVEQLLDMHQPQRNQGPDQLHLRVDVQFRVLRPVDDLNRAQRANLLALPDGA